MAAHATGRARLQDALRRKLERAVDYHGHRGRGELATIVDTDPVSAELHERRETIEEGVSLVLCQQVRQYDTDYGLEADDNLLVQLTHGGMWVAYAVVSDTDLTVTPR